MTALALKTGDLQAALEVVKSSDLGTLTLRREQLKQQISELKPQLKWERQRPAPRTEEQRQQLISDKQRDLAALQASLAAVDTLADKLVALNATLNETEANILSAYFGYRLRGDGVNSTAEHAKQRYTADIRATEERLAALGEPEPEWVDPRMEAAAKLATLEAALAQVNRSIKEAQSK